MKAHPKTPTLSWPWLYKGWVFFCVIATLFTLNFSNHTLSTLSLEKFLEGEFQSEAFAISRLIYNLDHGHEAQGGFMLRYPFIEMLEKSTRREDFTAFKHLKEENEQTHNKQPTLYVSHAGTQDDILRPFWWVLTRVKNLIVDNAKPGSRWEERMQTLDLYYFIWLTHGFVALLNGLAMAAFFLWVRREFGAGTALVAAILTMLALPVLGYFGRSVWWMMWTWYLPLLIMLWWMALRPAFRWYDVMLAGGLAAAAITLKVTMGYEYSPAVMMGILIPPAFYAVRHGWPWARYLKISIVLGILGFCGFMAGLIWHFQSLNAFGLDPWQVLQNRFEKRSHGGELAGMDGEIGESIRASTIGVFASYLFSTKELMPPQILLLAPFLWMIWQRYKSQNFLVDRDFLALCAALAGAFIGVMGMLIILKSHAYIHGFDIVVWSIPLNLFLVVIYARSIIKLINSQQR